MLEEVFKSFLPSLGGEVRDKASYVIHNPIIRAIPCTVYVAECWFMKLTSVIYVYSKTYFLKLTLLHLCLVII